MQELYEKIFADEAFQVVQRRRSRLSWTLAVLVSVVFFAFIGVIAFYPAVLAIPLHASTVITWGVPAGVFIIFLGITTTCYYVWRANCDFDVATEAIVRRLQTGD